MSDPRTMAQGVLEMHPKGYGFLRNPARNYAPTPADAVRPGAAHREVPPRRGAARSPARSNRRAAGRPARGSPPSSRSRAADPKQFRRRDWDELTADRPDQVDPPGDRPGAADHARHGPVHARSARASAA